jgi:hypothetical protein
LALVRFLTHLFCTSASFAEIYGSELKVAGERLRSNRSSKPTPGKLPSTIAKWLNVGK